MENDDDDAVQSTQEANKEAAKDETVNQIFSSIDITDPLFVHPSEHTNQLLAPTKFDGTGFTSWKKSVTIALKSKHKFGMVDGTIQQPEITSERYVQWDRCNSTVMSWILASLDRDIAESVLYYENAREIWLNLCQRFDQPSITEIYAIEEEITALRQDSDSISAYYTKLKKLWDRLGSLKGKTRCTCVKCTCGAASELEKERQQHKLIRFLMGLNDDFRTTRSNLLLMRPLPTVEQAYSLVAEDERQRKLIESRHQDLEASGSAFAMKGYSDSKERLKKFQPQSQSQNKKNAGGKKVVKCTNCAKIGHSRHECWWLIGRPDEQKSKMEKGSTSVNVTAFNKEENIQEINSAATQKSPVAGMSLEQIDQLVSYLKKSGQISNSGNTDTFGSFAGL